MLLNTDIHTESGKETEKIHTEEREWVAIGNAGGGVNSGCCPFKSILLPPTHSFKAGAIFNMKQCVCA